MPLDRGSIPVLEVGGSCASIWAAPMTMSCFVLEQPLLWGLLHAHTTIALDILASIGGIVGCLFLVGACSGFYSLHLALISRQSFLGVLLVFPGPVGSAHIVVVRLLQLNCT